LVLILLPILVAAGFAWKIYLETEYYLPVILHDQREITLEYGTEYKEPGAQAYYYDTLFQKEQIEVEVTIQGEVNTSVTDTYTLSYIARYEDFVGTAYRKIHVVDTQSPVITLVSNPDTYTYPGKPYEEEGFTAYDDYDGDLTALVHREEINGTVVYTVADHSGNVTQTVRTIRYLDPIPPQVQLVGREHMILFQGSVFKDPGATATDNYDGDLTKSITCTGEVDTQQIGSYPLTYTVLDSSGNQSSATRVVTVVPQLLNDGEEPLPADKLPEQIEPNEKVISLTFDDGPCIYTPDLLDVLKKYNVKATFFVVDTKSIDMVKRIYEEGHTVAVHSASHNYRKIYASEEAYLEDFTVMYDKILELTGAAPKLLRFPGGSSNTVSRFNKGIITRITEMMKEKGFRIFDWNVDSKDAGGAKTAQEVYENVIAGVQKNDFSVVLQHDIKSYSVEAVEKILQWGLANGYTFEALNENSPECEHEIAN